MADSFKRLPLARIDVFIIIVHFIEVRIFSNLKSEAGFTIVEIMIASAILLVLSLMIASMMFNSQKSQGKIEKRAADAALVQGVALDLRLKPVSP